MSDLGFEYVNDKKDKNGKNNNRRAVLLLHGLTGHPSELKFFGKYLSERGFDVFCPVLPGHCRGLNEIKACVWEDWLNFALFWFDSLNTRYEEVYVSGLCLGAVISVVIAEERHNVAGVSSLSATLFLDGWEMPWYRFLIPFGSSTIFRFFYSFPEVGSFGIKNERINRRISKMAKQNKTLLDCFPMVSFSEMLEFSKYAMKGVKKVETPILLFHSKSDNLTSVKSSEFIYNNASSKLKELIYLKNCYHVITLDNEKSFVAQKTVEFFNGVSKVKQDFMGQKNLVKGVDK